MDDDAVRLLTALRRAGCDTFIDSEDGQLYISPPLRAVRWAGDVEEAIAQYYDALFELVDAERMQVH